MSGSAGDWCLIESDPGVFTELIRGFGVEGVQVEELWSLSPEHFEHLKPIHGLIFLFKWLPGDDLSGSIVTDDRLNSIFFAKQVINNACATQAILSVLLNCVHEDVKLGKDLQDLKEFCASFDPTMKGLVFSNSDVIRTVHNSFARQNMFELEQKLPTKDDEVFHFIAYVPIGGRLYELDGLKEGPIDLGKVPDGSHWIELAKPVIEKRIANYSDNEIHFNLMAIISDKQKAYMRQLDEISKSAELDAAVKQDQIENLKRLIEQEQSKMHKYKIENIRRRHNYLPLIMEVLKALAQEGKLVELVSQAKKRRDEQKETAKKKQKETTDSDKQQTPS